MHTIAHASPQLSLPLFFRQMDFQWMERFSKLPAHSLTAGKGQRRRSAYILPAPPKKARADASTFWHMGPSGFHVSGQEGITSPNRIPYPASMRTPLARSQAMRSSLVAKSWRFGGGSILGTVDGRNPFRTTGYIQGNHHSRDS